MKSWKLFGSVGIVIVFFWFFGNILQAWLLIPTISEWLNPLGIGKYFSYALAVPVFFWVNCALGQIFSLRKSNRTIGFVMILGLFGALSLARGLQTQGDNFDGEGNSLNRYVQVSPGRVKILPATTKYDPETGQKTMPLTQEALREIEAAKRARWESGTGGLQDMHDMYKTLAKP